MVKKIKLIPFGKESKIKDYFGITVLSIILYLLLRFLILTKIPMSLVDYSIISIIIIIGIIATIKSKYKNDNYNKL